MRYSLVTVTPPTQEPVSLNELKLALRIDGSDEDSHLEGLLIAAREMVEAETGRATTLTTYRITVNSFGIGEIRLPRTPVVEVTGVTYYDYAGDQQTLATSGYRVLTGDSMRPGRLVPAYQTYWPQVRGHYDDVSITFTAGYATADDVPALLKRQIIVLTGFWFERPESRGLPIKGFDQVYDAIYNMNAVPCIA